MWPGADRDRRTIASTTLEGEGGGVEGDGQAKQRPIAEARIGTLLEVSEKPSVDAGAFRQLFSAQAQFSPPMRHTASQVAHRRACGPRRRFCSF
jgi:hypothetical protein